MSKKTKYIIFFISIIVFIGGMILISNFLESIQTTFRTSKTEESNNLEENVSEVQDTLTNESQISSSGTENTNEKNINSIIEVTSKTFKDEVLNSDRKVLVDFYADWCGPCNMIHPILEEIAEENPDIKVVQINIDNETNLSVEYGAMSIPLLVVFENGKEVDRNVGVVGKEYILDMLK